MRNLILFIRRFFNFILFLLLEIVCIVFIARTKNTIQGDEIVSTSNSVIGFLYKKQNDITYYFRLKEANDSLLNENKRLHDQIMKMAGTGELKDSSAVVATTLRRDSVKYIQYSDYTFRSARVINNSVNAANNFITISRGSKDGIKPDMSVVSVSGIVGKVVRTSGHFATVKSILGTNQPVSAKLKDGTYSFVTWDGNNPDILHMRNIPAEIKVAVGDSVFTTSFSTLFPPDILVGIVTRKAILKKDNSQILYIKPATNFRNLQFVYIIEDKMLQERKALEDSTTPKQK